MPLRMTNQREIILKELRKSRQHLSADELYERVKKFMPRISLATVYRNLETLSAAGIIAKLEISGRQKRFDYDVKAHDHIYCIQCHRVDNISFARELDSQPTQALTEGYTITGFRVEFIGICPACRKKTMDRKARPAEGGAKEMTTLTEEQRKILEALSRVKDPCSSKDIAAVTGLEAKDVAGRLAMMKKKGLVDSPVRCKYTATAEGKAVIG